MVWRWCSGYRSDQWPFHLLLTWVRVSPHREVATSPVNSFLQYRSVNENVGKVMCNLGDTSALIPSRLGEGTATGTKAHEGKHSRWSYLTLPSLEVEFLGFFLQIWCEMIYCVKKVHTERERERDAPLALMAHSREGSPATEGRWLQECVCVCVCHIHTHTLIWFGEMSVTNLEF